MRSITCSYARAAGKRDTGHLARFGARSTLAAECWGSLLGPVDFDRAIIAEYPRQAKLPHCP